MLYLPARISAWYCYAFHLEDGDMYDRLDNDKNLSFSAVTNCQSSWEDKKEPRAYCEVQDTVPQIE